MSKRAKLLLVLSAFIFIIIIFAVNSAIRSYEKQPAVTAPAQSMGAREPVSEPPDSRQKEAEKQRDEEGVEVVSPIDASQPLLQ